MAEYNIHTVGVQEHRYHHSEVEIKYQNTGNGWIFISASAWKNSINTVIGGVRMFLNPCALKSLDSIEKIQPRMMVDMFNGNPMTTIISCCSPTNASDETDHITFYNELSSLVRGILKYNLLIIGGNMNAQIGKNKNNKISLHNSLNRDEDHLTDFSYENEPT